MIGCACKSDDAYRCWAIRYERPFDSIETIRSEGGSCECMCHDEDEDAAIVDEDHGAKS